eukprot:scaffold27151_cov58-Cyclotella_meneghiniana.AAC.7
MALKLIFGMTMMPVGKYIQFARRILVRVLTSNDTAKISMPSNEKLEQYRSMIAARHPALHNVWGAMDGLKVTIEQAAGDFITQSRFYDGWKCDHFVTSVLWFAPDGTISAASFNVPGPDCSHDSTVADWGGFLTLRSLVQKWSISLSHCKTSSWLTINYLEDLEDIIDNLAVKRKATSMRQSAVWGMRGVQASFPRLKDTLPYEECSKRKMIIIYLMLLYNCCAHLVAINQIRSVYLP